MIVTMQKTIANVSTGMLQMRLVLCAAGGQNAGDWCSPAHLCSDLGLAKHRDMMTYPALEINGTDEALVRVCRAGASSPSPQSATVVDLSAALAFKTVCALPSFRVSVHREVGLRQTPTTQHPTL